MKQQGFAMVALVALISLGCGPRTMSPGAHASESTSFVGASESAGLAPSSEASSAAVVVGASREAIETALSALMSRVRAAGDRANPYDTLFPPRASLESLEIDDEGLALDFSAAMARRPWTPESKQALETAIREALGEDLAPAAALALTIGGTPFDEFVTGPDLIRRRELAREIPAKTLAAPLVQFPDDSAPLPLAGLHGRHLVIGSSHGWYYADTEDRWIYQRCRLFTTVEDLYPLSYINPFVIPMLENAGAVVFSLRERDFQTAEVLVDNDGVTGDSDFFTTGAWTVSEAPGWRGGRPHPLEPDTEPFTLGTTLEFAIPTADEAERSDAPPALAAYVPFLPAAGRYAVYASWAASPENSPSVPFTIRHLGGETTVRVNQQVAGNTWVFLGFYEFDLGKNDATGCVLVNAREATPTESALAGGPATRVSVDAIRFGGGMGNVAVEGTVSGQPRYAEACRYWAQYAGAPAEGIFYPGSGRGRFGTDYNRDLIARPEWTNYIHGAPNGPNFDRSLPGLGVPIDATLSFHTDAGISQNGLIGTLSIYRTEDQLKNAVFPDGRPRTLNRDLAALVHDEICRTVRAQYTSTWARRDLRDGNYSESRRPNIPSMLLELLSHQNFNDMKYGNDPRFKRDVSRAIYKALLRFLAHTNGYHPVVTPLEPTHLVAHHVGFGTIELTWRAQPDPLEPTARATGYVVQTSRDGRGFDNGFPVEALMAHIENVPEGEIRYFRVVATNAGGKSFPSRLVAARWLADTPPVLVVEGFDRIAGPAIVDEPDSRGFSRALDPGVGYIANYGLAGDQYDHNPRSPFLTNDQPGWGASEGDWESRLERGNTFDHIVPHAKALAEAGASFDSATAEAYAAGDIPTPYRIVNWIAGRQRATPPPAGMSDQGAPDRMTTDFVVLDPQARFRLGRHLEVGGALLLSGAYVVEDLTTGAAANDASRLFARESLGVAAHTSRATRTNTVRRSATPGPFDGIAPFRFGRDLEQTVYGVESAESFTPAVRGGGVPVLEYGDTGLAAALAGERAILFGFPLETVLPEKTRVDLLQAVLAHFETAR